MSDCKEQNSKATRKSISLETKMQVLRRLDAGQRQSDIGTALNLSTSTIRTILKNKEKIISSATTTTTISATIITRSRSNVIEEMEKRLAIWIDNEVECNMPLSQAIIMEKARTIFNHIQNEKGDIGEYFVASRGWFHRFKKRNNLHNILITGETASGDTKATAAFLNKNVDIRESIDDDEIVKLADQTGLNNINVQDIDELLQVTTDESFSHDGLKELVEQQMYEDDEVNVSEDEEQKELSTDFLKKSLITITKIMDQFVENDINFDRSSKARQSVIDAVSCYRQLLVERIRKKQTTLDDFVTKKQKVSNEEEQEPSSSQT